VESDDDALASRPGFFDKRIRDAFRDLAFLLGQCAPAAS
jgi:hypothetical protein